MTPDQIDKLLAWVLGIANIFVGAIITWWVSAQTLKRTERRRAQRELGKLQFAIISENLSHNYLLHLKALKDFFTANYDLIVKQTFNAEFFREWLQHPFIGTDGVVDPSLTAEKIAKLKNDVQKLRV